MQHRHRIHRKPELSTIVARHVYELDGDLRPISLANKGESDRAPKRLFARVWIGSFEFLIIKVDVTWGRRLFVACNAGVGHDRGVLDTVYAA